MNGTTTTLEEDLEFSARLLKIKKGIRTASVIHIVVSERKQPVRRFEVGVFYSNNKSITWLDTFEKLLKARLSELREHRTRITVGIQHMPLEVGRNRSSGINPRHSEGKPEAVLQMLLHKSKSKIHR